MDNTHSINHKSDMEAEQLKMTQVALLYEGLPLLLVSTSISAILLACLIYKSVAIPHLLAWLVIYFLIVFARYIISRKYRPDEVSAEETDLWIKLYMFGTFLTGMMWGGLPYLINTSETVYYLLISLLWVFTLVAVAVVQQAILIRIFFVYSLPAMLPIAVYLLKSDNSDYYFFASAQLLFYCFLLLNIFRINKIFTNSIKLQFSNTELLDELNLEKTRVNALNDELKMDIDDRIKIENELREEQSKVEDLVKKLLLLSTQDGLTGIANRRHFDEFLAKEWGRAARSKAPLSLILADIDDFKAYNDHYGHQEGDKCLCQVADILAEHARRGGDLAARYGGEEFAIVLSDTNSNDALNIAKQIHQTINLRAIPHMASKIDNIITLSLGIATIIPNKDIFPPQLVSRADKALYQAKQNGRNQIVCAESEVAGNQNNLA